MKKFISIILLAVCLSTPSFAVDFGLSSEITTLASAGVRQPITASVTRSADFIIQNPSSNVDSIFVGGSDVTTSGATRGVEISPGGSLGLSSSSGLRNSNILSSNVFMVSAGTAVPVVVARVTIN